MNLTALLSELGQARLLMLPFPFGERGQDEWFGVRLNQTGRVQGVTRHPRRKRRGNKFVQVAGAVAIASVVLVHTATLPDHYSKTTPGIAPRKKDGAVPPIGVRLASRSDKENRASNSALARSNSGVFSVC